jgi:hypothetical protein
MEAENTSETSANFYEAAQRKNEETAVIIELVVSPSAFPQVFLHLHISSMLMNHAYRCSGNAIGRTCILKYPVRFLTDLSILRRFAVYLFCL